MKQGRAQAHGVISRQTLCLSFWPSDIPHARSEFHHTDQSKTALFRQVCSCEKGFVRCHDDRQRPIRLACHHLGNCHVYMVYVRPLFPVDLVETNIIHQSCPSGSSKTLFPSRGTVNWNIRWTKNRFIFLFGLKGLRPQTQSTSCDMLKQVGLFRLWPVLVSHCVSSFCCKAVNGLKIITATISPVNSLSSPFHPYNGVTPSYEGLSIANDTAADPKPSATYSSIYNTIMRRIKRKLTRIRHQKIDFHVKSVCGLFVKIKAFHDYAISDY